MKSSILRTITCLVLIAVFGLIVQTSAMCQGISPVFRPYCTEILDTVAIYDPGGGLGKTAPEIIVAITNPKPLLASGKSIRIDNLTFSIYDGKDKILQVKSSEVLQFEAVQHVGARPSEHLVQGAAIYDIAPGQTLEFHITKLPNNIGQQILTVYIESDITNRDVTGNRSPSSNGVCGFDVITEELPRLH